MNSSQLSIKTSIYLDNSATTKLDVRALDAMIPLYLQDYGNTSSLHHMGQVAGEHLEHARNTISTLLHCTPEEVVFTSGGTEANNLAIFGVMRQHKKAHLIVSSIEHSSVLRAAECLEREGHEVTFLPIDSEGRISVIDLKKELRPHTKLVSIMHVNNEVGTIQDISALSNICKDKQVLFHMDAVQSLGKIPIDVTHMGADLVSVSAHKIHGPKGIGALYARKGISLLPCLIGGSHEQGLRAGTVNVASAVGFAVAASLMGSKELERMHQLGKRLLEGLLSIEGSHLNGSKHHRLAHVMNVRFDNVDGEALMFALNTKGVYVSMGSACSAKERGPSHILLAMGLDTQKASNSLRFSLSKFTTEAEVDMAIEIVRQCVKELRL